MSLIVRDLPGTDPHAPIEIGEPQYEYPFLKNGDGVSFLVTRTYKQTVTGYNRDRLAGRYIPGCTDVDREHPDAYLIAEERPTRNGHGRYIFTRTFARIPAQQTVPSSLFITKPSLSGSFPQVIGDALVLQPDSTVAQYEFYTRKTVTSDSGAPTITYATGGTYTVTIGASTTGAIAYNASAATLQTALNALASVTARGSVTVTGSYNSVGGFTITFDTLSAPSIDVSLLTESGSGVVVGSATARNAKKSRVNFVAYSTEAASAGADINGGTYTLTLLGQTTGAIAYNADSATIQSAVQALSNVGALGTVSVDDGTTPLGEHTFPGANSLDFTVTLALPSASIDYSSLTPTGSTGTLTPGTTDSQSFTLTFAGQLVSTRTLTAPAHGISASDDIFVSQAGSYITLDSGGFSVPSGDLIIFGSAAGSVLTGGSITLVGRKTATTYTSGTKLTRIKRVTDFFLPGVSPGISTADDIPLPTYQGDDSSLLEAILAGSTSINYEVGELQQWRESPILMRTITTLNASQL